MDVHPATTRIDIRRPFSGEGLISLIGPGGVGKSTLGAVLAERLGRTLLDLDHQFMARIGHIGQLIDEHGYDWYATENSRLAGKLIAELDRAAILATSSGFLASPGLYANNLALLQSGYSITLLPSPDIDQATSIVVERQMQRGFGFERQNEIEKFRRRFALYYPLGEMLVVSMSPVSDMATAVLAALGQPAI
ncbi:shikimate kinase [Devosia sp.]|uniref:shikimate kinase n=1 Tax=Devosia sp. TaxID=1871048 RepID=UPI003263BF7A